MSKVTVVGAGNVGATCANVLACLFGFTSFVTITSFHYSYTQE